MSSANSPLPLSSHSVSAFPPPRLSESFCEELIQAVGDSFVSRHADDRLIYARDMWPRTVIQTRLGRVAAVPDAVVRPGSAEDVATVLALASKHKVPVVTYAAGSGVCGGTIPLRGGIILDVKRLNRVHGVDDESLVLDVDPGVYGQRLEMELNRIGYTLGHFPSSIACSTVGGWIAARSAGQLSSRYGKIEDLVVSLQVALADGSLVETRRVPTYSQQPDPTQLMLGSEGTFGVITRARLRVRRLPTHRSFQAYSMEGVQEGLEAMRAVMQAGLKPAVLRLYDEFDSLVAGSYGGEADGSEPGLHQTFEQGKDVSGKALAEKAISLAKGKGLGEALRRPLFINLFTNTLPPRCNLVILCEGEADEARREMEAIREILSGFRAEDRGEGPARYWLKHRYSVSYKQSKIFATGAFVDTMEVAASWKDIARLYDAVRDAVKKDAFIMAHFSHAYRDGCCCYFSFAAKARREEDTVALYDRLWQNALSAVRRAGGTITHHHGVGLSKSRFLPPEYGKLDPLFVALKQSLDPDDLLNPGKLGGER